MRFAGLLIVFMAVAATILVRGAARKVDFSNDTVGQSPKGFEFGYTAKVGAPGKWVIQAEGPNKYLAQTDPDSTRSRFPVAVLADVSAADVDLSVRFRPVSGRVDQAAVSCGAIATRTITTSCARTRSKTTSCSTRWRTANALTCR